MKGVAYGILLDFLFIIAYVALGVWTLKGCAKAVPEIPWWEGAGTALFRWFVLAGVFDIIENIGILFELYRGMYWLAPVTALFALAKWTIVGLAFLYAVFTAVLCLRRLTGSDEELEELEKLEEV